MSAHIPKIKYNVTPDNKRESNDGKQSSPLSIFLKEFKAHAPFTIIGALTGVIIMALCQNFPQDLSYQLFYILHPFHVLLSALVTASIYKLHKCKRIGGKCIKGECNFWVLALIGYTGSIGIATLSDSLIPYFGEVLLHMPNRRIHLGFLEKWWLVNPLAILGSVIAFYKPTTKFPHAGHVLLSTWASLFHIIMAIGDSFHGAIYLAVAIFLFFAVWVPCCVSDILFPLLILKKSEMKST